MVVTQFPDALLDCFFLILIWLLDIPECDKLVDRLISVNRVNLLVSVADGPSTTELQIL